DLSLLFVTSPSESNKTVITHELRGLFTAEAQDFSKLDYFMVADLDNNPDTGADPSCLGLGIPAAVGAELVTRVHVNPVIEGGANPLLRNLVTTPSVFTFDGSCFTEQSDTSIASRSAPSVAPLDNVSGCGSDATFSSIDCRLDELIALVTDSNELGKYQD